MIEPIRIIISGPTQRSSPHYSHQRNPFYILSHLHIQTHSHIKIPLIHMDHVKRKMFDENCQFYLKRPIILPNGSSSIHGVFDINLIFLILSWRKAWKWLIKYDCNFHLIKHSSRYKKSLSRIKMNNGGYFTVILQGQSVNFTEGNSNNVSSYCYPNHTHLLTDSRRVSHNCYGLTTWLIFFF